MEDGFAGSSQKANRSRPSRNSRTQKATTANASNASLVPSSSLPASLLSGTLTDPGFSGVAGIDVMLGRSLSPLLAMTKAAVACEACGGSLCANQLAKRDAPASMARTTTRDEAPGRAFPGGNILRSDPLAVSTSVVILRRLFLSVWTKHPSEFVAVNGAPYPHTIQPAIPTSSPISIYTLHTRMQRPAYGLSGILCLHEPDVPLLKY